MDRYLADFHRSRVGLKMLHITNGDSVIRTFRQTKVPGKYLSWVDVLHDGPVPDQSPRDLAKTRAEFISSAGWASYDDVLRQLTERDSTLTWHESDDEIVLWFEHDLFDQLQLIQVLDRLAAEEFGARLSLINVDSFPEVENFHGLGELDAKQLASLFPERIEIKPQHLNLGRRAWNAFRAPHPMPAFVLANDDTSALPYLRAALFRWFEEFPSTNNGLSRSEEQFLRAAIDGAQSKRDLYRKSQASEEAIFMGDSSAFRRMEGLASGPKPALTQIGDAFELTDFGRALLAGEADWIRDRGGIDVWLGGTHLNCPTGIPRWNKEDRSFVTI
jgi:hypothetical protein